MSTATKIVFIIGTLLLVYGFLCRLLSIYFFWDSKYFGWLGIISALLLFLIDIRLIRVRQRKNIFFVRFFVALLIIILALEAGAIAWVKSTKAYDEMLEQIETSEAIKTEMGEIKGFSWIPGINIVDILKAPGAESLNFVITVRGEKLFREMEVTIARTSVTEWSVVSFREI